MAEEQKYQAVALSPVGRYALGVRWGDGHETVMPTEALRALCRCAHCQGEPDYPITGKRRPL